MIVWNGIHFPNGELHLQEWMSKVDRRDDLGRLTYQAHKLDAAMAHVRKRRVAVDVGAHVGLWSMQLVRMFGFVHAFEPMSEHRACFERNVVPGVGRVTLYPFALGAAPGKVQLARWSPDSSGDTGVDPEAEQGSKRTRPAEAIREDADLRTIDSFGLEDVDFIKIDCEGYELFVLQGAVETLRRCRPCIIVEQKPETGMQKRYGVKPGAAVDFLKGLGAKVRAGIQGDFVMSWG